MNDLKARPTAIVALTFAVLTGAACTGADAVLVTNSLMAANSAVRPPVMRAVDGIPGWTRTGAPERFNKEGLYGHIDGGAELVLQYGFRELSVFTFRPSSGSSDAAKELTLEIYRMDSGPAAFGLYSIKLEGGEEGRPGLKPAHWISPGQANLVKGEYLVNILAQGCTDDEIGRFAAAVARKIPAPRTERPKGMKWLPAEGMVRGSGRYIKGQLAAQNESPFLEPPFWGFATAGGEEATEAFSAKYGAPPAVSKLIVVKLRKAPTAGALAERMRTVFEQYLLDVRREADAVEGRSEAGTWFLFKAEGRSAALVQGEPDREAGRKRVDAALARAGR